MSVAEMKIEAISKITSLQNEELLKRVLSLLEEAKTGTDHPNLSSNYDVIKAQYGDVLQKLAQ